MRSHAATHDKVRPFQCEICPKKFSRKSGLKKHVKQVHTPKNTTNQIQVTTKIEPGDNEMNKLEQKNENEDLLAELPKLTNFSMQNLMKKE